MKKLLTIVVLGLLINGNAYTKIIELKKCSTSNQPFNPKNYINVGFKIDTNKSILQRVRIMTDSYYEDQKKEFMKEFGNTIGLEKFSIWDFNIEYFDDRFVKAKRKYSGNDMEATWEIDLKNKTALFKRMAKSSGTLWKCK